MWYGYATKRYRLVPVGSPPIACSNIDLTAFRLRLSRYLDTVIEDHLYTFFEYQFGAFNQSYLFTSSRGIVSLAIYRLYLPAVPRTKAGESLSNFYQLPLTHLQSPGRPAEASSQVDDPHVYPVSCHSSGSEKRPHHTTTNSIPRRPQRKNL